jgi:hypothetical protein
MPGYFKVSLEAARQLVNASERPELLAGYLILCEGAYGLKRRVTSHGAKSISKYSGCTDWRSKWVMNILGSLRCGDRGTYGFIEKTDQRQANAAIYLLGDWPGQEAYVPSLLIKPRGDIDAPLRLVLQGDGDAAIKRDALHLLLHLHANTDYAGWMGAAPDVFPSQSWDVGGSRPVGGVNVCLGQVAAFGDAGIWAVAPPTADVWQTPKGFPEILFGQTPDAPERARRGLRFLLEYGLACKAAVVIDGSESYPLWLFNPAYRESLRAEFGINAGLAHDFYSLVGDSHKRPISRALNQNRRHECTGVYFCVARSTPAVRTVLVPRLHAPTL